MKSTRLSRRIGFSFRDAFADHAAVASHQAFASDTARKPLVTIAVPTFRRAQMLVDTLRSCALQDFAAPFEIIVVDNDPSSEVWRDVVSALPELATHDFRYFVNADNLGMFGNFNRCIELARGPWLTIINDDDLLDAPFLSTMLAEIGARPGMNGIICRKAFVDERENAGQVGAVKRIERRLLLEWNFLGRTVRRIRPGTFFWGAVLGNGAGFVFRRKLALEMGGFYPEEFPASDYWFFARFSALHGLWQHRAALARVRIAENETAKAETVKSGMLWGSRLQTALVGTAVPRWYRLIHPTLLARHLAEFQQFWRSKVTKAEMEEVLGIALPADRRILLRVVQLALRGF